MITAEQCYSFGMVGTIGIVLSLFFNENLPHISKASLIIGILLIGTALIGSVYISFKSINNLNLKRKSYETIE